MSAASTNLLIEIVEAQVQKGNREVVVTLEIIEKCLESHRNVAIDPNDFVEVLIKKVDEVWSREGIGTLAGRAVSAIGRMSKLHNISDGKTYIERLYGRQDSSEYTRDPYFWDSVRYAYEEIKR